MSLDSFDGFTREAASIGMFNDDQLDHMRYLSSLPREAKCRCGWYPAGECYNCHHADFRRHGIKCVDWVTRYHDRDWDQRGRSVLDYRLPDGCMTGYRGAIEWVKRQEA